ncbi:porin family protein [Arcicella sp. LKC2W]|uniref:porin family protein n=1 Tax=Arcicella sp. LKC2W TaxID=2984198 RepID=UPI002B1F61C9|nr:porin family protein [Arcicella sp. LKC2W]MEA5458931.1 porin family protein [Arcicella sp. LKC2W]
MKNHIILALLLVCMSGTIALAQTKKPTTTTKKPTTTVKASPAKKTTKTTTTTSTPVVSQPIEQKKTTTTTTSSSPQQTNSSTTTTIQSTGPSKGTKAKTPEPEREEKVEKVREEKPEKVRIPKVGPDNDGKVRFGIRAEATQLYTLESGGNYDLSPGVNAGLIVNLPISQVVSIQPEILYSMTTGKITEDADNYAKSTGSSILVPLMFNFNFGNGSTKFMLNLGGYGNYALSQTSKVVVGGTTIIDGSVDLGNDKFDYGAGLGLGVKLNNSLMIEARSFYSLKDNINKSGIGTIGIGYLF